MVASSESMSQVPKDSDSHGETDEQKEEDTSFCVVTAVVSALAYRSRQSNIDEEWRLSVCSLLMGYLASGISIFWKLPFYYLTAGKSGLQMTCC